MQRKGAHMKKKTANLSRISLYANRSFVAFSAFRELFYQISPMFLILSHSLLLSLSLFALLMSVFKFRNVRIYAQMIMFIFLFLSLSLSQSSISSYLFVQVRAIHISYLLLNVIRSLVFFLLLLLLLLLLLYLSLSLWFFGKQTKYQSFWDFARRFTSRWKHTSSSTTSLSFSQFNAEHFDFIDNLYLMLFFFPFLIAIFRTLFYCSFIYLLIKSKILILHRNANKNERTENEWMKQTRTFSMPYRQFTFFFLSFLCVFAFLCVCAAFMLHVTYIEIQNYIEIIEYDVLLIFRRAYQACNNSKGYKHNNKNRKWNATTATKIPDEMNISFYLIQ